MKAEFQALWARGAGAIHSQSPEWTLCISDHQLISLRLPNINNDNTTLETPIVWRMGTLNWSEEPVGSVGNDLECTSQVNKQHANHAGPGQFHR